MKTGITFKYIESEKKCIVHGYPELEGRLSIDVGEGMVTFFGNGWRSYDFYIANTITDKIRHLATVNGHVLVSDEEIDYEAISKKCENGYAVSKPLRYADLNR